jgi:phage-related protein
MPRSTDPQLEAWLPECETQSTVDITLRDKSSFRFATDEIDLGGGVEYFNFLLRVGGLKQTGSVANDTVNLRISNTDRQWGLKVASELRNLTLGEVVVKRFYAPKDMSRSIWRHKHIFTGKIVNAEALTEKKSKGVFLPYVSLDLIPETTAMGVCFAYRTLSPLCGWIFKDHNCRYLGSNVACDLHRKSRGGCSGNNNLASNGGWTSPDNPAQGVPGDGGGVGDGENPCFIGQTPIWTPRGLVPIRDFKKYWRVYSRNPLTWEIETDTVAEVFRHWVTGYFLLEFEGGAQIGVTPEHPFLHESGEYVAADRLKFGRTNGDRVWRYDRQARGWRKVRLSGVRWRRELTEVFNLHVLRNNNFLADLFDVHNTKLPPDFPTF